MNPAKDCATVFIAILFLIEGHRRERYLEEKWASFFLGITYFVIDTVNYVETVDMIVHHALSIWICMYSVSNTASYEVLKAVTNTEWSTIPLVYLPYLTGRPKRITKYLFGILFLIFRIGGLFPLLYTDELSFLDRVPIVLLYILNVYWLLRILKIM